MTKKLNSAVPMSLISGEAKKTLRNTNCNKFKSKKMCYGMFKSRFKKQLNYEIEWPSYLTLFMTD